MTPRVPIKTIPKGEFRTNNYVASGPGGHAACWYDCHIRSWICYRSDADGRQLDEGGDPHYTAQRFSAMAIIRDLVREPLNNT